MENDKLHRIGSLSWEGEGFLPLVSFESWLVALMNWELRFDLSQAGVVERHNLTDEVFVLIKGRSLLYIRDQAGVEAVDMQPGVVYNIPKATYHNVIGTKDATWLIVENNNTTAENTEFYTLNPQEMEALVAQYPDWLK